MLMFVRNEETTRSENAVSPAKYRAHRRWPFVWFCALCDKTHFGSGQIRNAAVLVFRCG